MKQCSVAPCPRPVLARGWCATHYQRWRTSGDPGPADLLNRKSVPGEVEKPCSRCKVVKPLSEFYVDKRNAGRLFSQCKTCTISRQKPTRMLRLYGLTPEAHDRMVAEAGGRCAVCRESATLVIDHDHRTGKVRDLLCDRCNRLLGAVDDRIELLERAAEYVRKHRKV